MKREIPPACSCGNLSAVFSASAHMDISPVAATTGDDRLLYDGGALNGLTGIDTIEFRLGENLDFSTSPVKATSIERFNLMPSGYNHSLGHLSAQDALDVTEVARRPSSSRTALTQVSLKSTVGGIWSASGSQTVDGPGYDVYVNSQDAAFQGSDRAAHQQEHRSLMYNGVAMSHSKGDGGATWRAPFFSPRAYADLPRWEYGSCGPRR